MKIVNGIASVLFVLVTGVHAQSYDVFKVRFGRLMKRYDWGKNDRERIAKCIWFGTGRDYKLSAYAACIGVVETHYTRDEPGKDYSSTQGYLGTHNRTVIAEMRRLHMSKSLNVYEATWIGAKRWRYIVGIYGPVSLKQWNQGEGWKHDVVKRMKAEEYETMVTTMAKRWF